MNALPPREDVSSFSWGKKKKVVESFLTDLLAAIWDPGVPEQLHGTGREPHHSVPPAVQFGLGLTRPLKERAGDGSHGEHPCTVISGSKSHF